MTPLELDLPVLDLDTVFLPSLPSQESISMIQDKKLLDSQPKFPSPPPLFIPNLPPLVIPSLENIDVNSPKERKEKSKCGNEALKKSNKKPKIVKLECIDEVASVEAIKEVERKLWLTHYNQLCDKWLEVVREKCTGCQTYETNYPGHELCLLISTEE